MRLHADERRLAYCDLFPTTGDVNLFVVFPGERTCWHRHQKQTDYFRVIRGEMLIGVRDPGAAPFYLRLDEPSCGLVVPAGSWHGYENIGTDPAYLLMYLDRKYDPADEERMNEAELPWRPPLAPLVDDAWNKGQDPPDETTT